MSTTRRTAFRYHQRPILVLKSSTILSLANATSSWTQSCTSRLANKIYVALDRVRKVLARPSPHTLVSVLSMESVSNGERALSARWTGMAILSSENISFPSANFYSIASLPAAQHRSFTTLVAVLKHAKQSRTKRN